MAVSSDGASVKVIETDLPGCLVLEPQVFGDKRGYFYESFNSEKLAGIGLHPQFVQGNVSSSTRGVLRGLHYQWPNPQGKLVSVLEGEVYKRLGLLPAGARRGQRRNRRRTPRR